MEKLKSPLIPIRDWNAAMALDANGIDSVEITSNPYQGLKHDDDSRCIPCWAVEITSNPYQGLKRGVIAACLASLLKLKSPLIPIRDWNSLEPEIHERLAALKSPLIPIRDWNFNDWWGELWRLIVEITSNPYQGLKPKIWSYSMPITAAGLKSPLIPIRDWNQAEDNESKLSRLCWNHL